MATPSGTKASNSPVPATETAPNGSQLQGANEPGDATELRNERDNLIAWKTEAQERDQNQREHIADLEKKLKAARGEVEKLNEERRETVTKHENEKAELLRTYAQPHEEGDEIPFPLDLVPTEHDPDGNPGLVSASPETGEFGYHQSVSFSQDAGYQKDAIRSRLISGVDAALAPARIGRNAASDEPEWKGFPPFDAGLKLHLAVWVE